MATKKSTAAAAEGEVISSTAPVDHTPSKLQHDEDAHTAANASFSAQKSDRGIVSVRPVGWVGPDPLNVHEDHLDALLEVLNALK